MLSVYFMIGLGLGYFAFYRIKVESNEPAISFPLALFTMMLFWLPIHIIGVIGALFPKFKILVLRFLEGFL